VSLEVVEVLGRSEQGMTQPYICRCSDGEVYFVKGNGASRRSQISEWLCGHLAQALGLPIAPFAIADVPQELIEADLTGWLKDLGAGAAFASRKVMGQELALSQVPSVPLSVRRDVLVFDWWVRNGDRCLTPLGGNVNLLWQPAAVARDADDAKAAQGALAVIDHNLAFDEDFDRSRFCADHVFAADVVDVYSDFVLRQAYVDRMHGALAQFGAAWENVPPAWSFKDSEQTVPIHYPKDRVWAMLKAIESPGFWNLPT
jgi:hypothetical protein